MINITLQEHCKIMVSELLKGKVLSSFLTVSIFEIILMFNG